jgi:uncharacterized protein
MPRQRALIIVGKAPRPGQSKTRLVPPLSPDDAAALSGAFLRDTVALALALNWERVSVVHPASPDEAELLAKLLPSGVRCAAQTGVGLGDALRSAFASHFAEGLSRVVLIDSDSPTLPPLLLEQACAALEEHDMAIGPSADGGYYLLALRQPRPSLFEDIAWSTDRVYQQTVQRAAGLLVHELPQWYDVDTLQDLSRLEADLRNEPMTVAVHTRAALAALGPLDPLAHIDWRARVSG